MTRAWNLDDEVNHKGIKCVICANKVSLGHQFTVQTEEPYTIAHASCVEHVKQEETNMTTRTELEKLTLTQLVDLYNSKVAEEKAIKKFGDKKTAITRILALDTTPGANDKIRCPIKNHLIPAAGCETRQNQEKNKCVKSCTYLKVKPAKEKAKTPRSESKVSKVRAAFAEKKSWTLFELMKVSGFDKSNLQCQMSILQNPTRTKEEDRIYTEYDRATETYTLIKK